MQLHNKSDAPQSGYGQCSYLRLIDENGRIHCSLVMGKAHVATRETVTIPRLELTAATISVRAASMLKEELDYEELQEFHWTDSKVVHGFINNESRRFQVYVANRVQLSVTTLYPSNGDTWSLELTQEKKDQEE